MSAPPRDRPYPAQYVWPWQMKDGSELVLRPIRPEDETMMAQFHRALSERTVYQRYFSSLSLSRRVDHDRLQGVCFGGYDREIVLVAERRDPRTGGRHILGVGRLNKLGSENKEGELAVLVADQYQNQGLGAELVRRAIQIAREEKLTRVLAEILRDNIAMDRIFRQFGFRFSPVRDSESTTAVLELGANL